MADSDATVAAWRAAGEAGDAPAARACLAPDVELISPLTEAFRFRGPAQVGDVLAAAFTVIDGIRFHTEVGDGATRALFYKATARGQLVEEAQLLRLDDGGLIRELTFFGRPLPALTAVLADLGRPLLRAQGRPALARLVTGEAQALTQALTPALTPAGTQPSSSCR